jgi:hypothetical protein
MLRGPMQRRDHPDGWVKLEAALRPLAKIRLARPRIRIALIQVISEARHGALKILR